MNEKETTNHYKNRYSNASNLASPTSLNDEVNCDKILLSIEKKERVEFSNYGTKNRPITEISPI